MLSLIYRVDKQEQQLRVWPDPPRQSCYALNDQVITGEGPRLVKAADVHLATKWYPERFCTEDTCKRQQLRD